MEKVSLFKLCAEVKLIKNCAFQVLSYLLSRLYKNFTHIVQDVLKIANIKHIH